LGVGSNGDILTLAAGVPSWAAATTGSNPIMSGSWLYDSTTTAASPDANSFRFNQTTPAAATILRIIDGEIGGLDAGDILSHVGLGNQIRIYDAADPTTYTLFTVAGAPSDQTGYWNITVDQVEGSATFPADTTECIIQFDLSAFIAVGTLSGNQKDMAYWDGDKWAATGSAIRINQATPPVGGRFNVTGASSTDTQRSVIFLNTGNSTSGMWYADGPAGEAFYAQHLGSGNSFVWGFDNDSSETDLFGITVNNDFAIYSAATFVIGEKAAAGADIGGYGQIWIRNDAPNTLMFTDDAGNDSVVSGNTTEVDYNYSSAVTSTDPGAGSLNFNSVTIGSITTLYIDDLISTGQDYGWALSNLADGDILTIRSVTDPADYIVASINGAPTDSTGFWTIALTLIHTGTIFTNGDQVRISIQWFSQAGGVPTQITVADSSDTTSFPAFFESATGDLGPKTDASNYTYNATSGALTAVTFVGALTGNADTATTATNATNITLADESADTTCFPIFATGATGDLPPKTGSNLTFNSSTGDLSATSFGGITEANLVDKTAAESISAAWTWTDSNAIILGTGSDLTMQSTGLDVFFDLGTTSDWSLRGGSTGTEVMITAVADLGVGLYHNGIEQATTLTSANGGLEVKNQYNGPSPSTRVLTSADKNWGTPNGMYQFDTGTTAADPGSGRLRFNNATPSSVTNLYVDDLSDGNDTTSKDMEHLLLNLADNDVIHISIDADGIGTGYIFQVNGTPTDNTGYWTIPVTVVYDNGDSLPSNSDTVVFSAELLSLGGSGTVTSVAAGDGLDFTTITTTGSVTLGTPGTTSTASTNAVTATSHTHALTTTGTWDGNAVTATTATGATNIDINATTSTDTTTYPVLVGAASTGNQLPFIDNVNLSYNASTNALTATTFVGALTGNADTATSAAGWTTGRTITLSGDVSGTSPSWDGTGNLAFSGTVVANDSHTHGDSTIDGLDASATTTGTFDPARLRGTTHGVTAASNFVEYNRFGASFDLDNLREPGQYGVGSSPVNGPTGLTFDPMWVGASSSDVTSQLVVPRTASRGLAWRGETSDVFTSWHYALWSTTAPTANISATPAEINLLDLSGLTAGWVLSADTATTASWKAPTGGGLANIVEDVTPQLGADLDSNTFDIDMLDNDFVTFGSSRDVAIGWDAVDLEITGLAGGQGINFRDGPLIRIYDSTDAAYMQMNSSTTTFTMSGAGGVTDITWTGGLTTLNAGGVDADFDAITATSYGGITEANLLDKTATETVSGSWTHTATWTIENTQPVIRLNETGVTANEGNWRIEANVEEFLIRTDVDAENSPVTAMTITRTGTTPNGVDFNAAVTATSYGGITEANLVDKTATETITGTWTLDGDVTTADYGTGGRVKDGLDNAQPIGFNTMPVYEIDAADTFDLAHVGMVWHKDAGGAVTFTCNNDTTIPIGAMYMVHNDDTENLTIAEGTATIEFLFPGAAPIGGNVTVEQGGIVTVYKYTDAIFWVWGAKSAVAGSTPTVITVADESADTTCFPAFFTATTGDLGPKTGTNLTFNSSTGDLSATLIAGITAANLVDKAATEAITGTWTLDGAVTTSDFGTGGQVKDGTDVARPIGFNTIPVYEIDAADTFDLAHNGMMWHKDAGGAVTFTCNNDATIPQGATYFVHNDDTENLTIAEGTATIEFLSPGAAPVGGNVTVEQGGIVTVYKYSDAIFWVWGSKAPEVATQITVADESADTTCFPMFSTAATGDIEPKTGTNLTFNSSTGSLSSTLLTTLGDHTLTGGSVFVQDSESHWVGTGNDARFYFNATNTLIDCTGAANNFFLRVNGSETALLARPNAEIELYYNGVVEFETQDSNATDNITGALVKHFDQSFYDVGLAVMPEVTTTGVLTISDTHQHKTVRITSGTGAISFVSDSTMAIGSVGWIINTSGSNNTITATTNIYWCDGAGGQTGSRTLADGGWLTWWKQADAQYYITGVGIT
jgi:hypothetical protein